jgi:hypothetical protein
MYLLIQTDDLKELIKIKKYQKDYIDANKSG